MADLQESDLQTERLKIFEEKQENGDIRDEELRIQRELLGKTKRSYHNLEVYLREVSLRRDGELEETRKEIKRLVRERIKAEEQQRQEDDLRSKHLSFIQAKIQVDIFCCPRF